MRESAVSESRVRTSLTVSALWPWCKYSVFVGMTKHGLQDVGSCVGHLRKVKSLRRILGMAIKERKYRDAVLEGLYTFTATQGWSKQSPAAKAGNTGRCSCRPNIPFPNRIETLHRRRRTMLLPRTPPRSLLVRRLLVVLVDLDLPLLMDRDNERSPRRATFRRSRSREPRESRHRDSVMGRCPLCRWHERRFALNRRHSRFLEVDNAEARIDQAPARDRKGEKRDAVQGGERHP